MMTYMTTPVTKTASKARLPATGKARKMSRTRDGRLAAAPGVGVTETEGASSTAVA